MNVGTMKDYKLKLRNLHTSDALGGAGDWNTERYMRERQFYFIMNQERERYRVGLLVDKDDLINYQLLII